MDLTPYLLAWRTTPLRDREVVDALVDPAHAGPSPELAHALTHWPGNYYWSDEPDGRHLVLTRPRGSRRREHWTLHTVLFGATLLTTTLAGAVIAAGFPFDGLLGFPRFPPPAGFARLWAAGLLFSLPLLTILLCHELGHYFTARYYHLDVSPPYFAPVPLVLSPIGTVGAFIRLRTILSDRRQLLDVGIGGPIAGFLIALPVLWIGLALSHPGPVHEGLGGMVVRLGGQTWALGDSLLTLVLRRASGLGEQGLSLHPLAFAGWVGMFVTMLNLLPISQLDGGHILYAAVPRWHARVALVCWVGLVVLGKYWIGWLVFGALVLGLSRGQLKHPPVLDAYRPLPRSRQWLAWAALALFLATFTPVPFRI
ncbi:MAG: site-2 protease family protein [Gemmatimonadales bacterium]